MTERPLIGVLLDEEPAPKVGDFSKRPFYALRKDYFTAIARAGGLGVGVPYDVALMEDYLARCDGFVLPGGDYRFFADWYASPPPAEANIAHESPRRGFEAVFAKRLLDDDRPVLGVCQGMQAMAGVLGSKMVWGLHAAGPDKLAHFAKDGVIPEHAVTVAENTALRAVWGAPAHVANSAHTEAVATPGAGVRVTGTAPDGVVEAIEIEGKRFALGVQWHPELMLDDPRQLALFEALVNAAREARARG